MKVKLLVPENLNDITLRQYQKYLLLEDPTTKDIVSIFLGIKKKDVGKISKKQVDSIAADVVGLFNEKASLVSVFNYRGIEWGFIPNLDAMGYDENDDATDSFGDWQELHKTMSVLYRPITKKKGGKYLIEEYDEPIKYSEMLRDMPLGICFGAYVFFYTLFSDLLKAIPNYIHKTITQEELAVLLQNGVDTTALFHSLKEIYSELRALLSYPSIAV